MNSRLLKGLLKVAPLGISALAVFLALHGVHVVSGRDPLGPGGANHLQMVSSGDPLGPGGPNS